MAATESRRGHRFARTSYAPVALAVLASPALADEVSGLRSELLKERSHEIGQSFTSDAEKERLWAALVFGTPLLHELSESEMMALAMKGGAVSPVTSYLAIEPGVRPSTEGIDWGGSGQGFGSGRGRLGGACGPVSGKYPTLDREAFLRDALARDFRRCGGRPGTATVVLETTRAEIVHIESIDVSGGDELLERCFRESVWELVLPAAFSEEWNRWSISV